MALRTYYPYPKNDDLFEKAREEIFAKVSIPQYIMDNVDSTVDLFQKNKMCCPMHEENTPSFVYNEDKNIWTCYGKCQRSGKVIDLHMHLHGIKNYPSALMHFKQMYGARYNLNFVDFFMYEGNKEMRVEDVIGMTRNKPKLDNFLKPKEKSPSFLVDQIDRALAQLKMYSKDAFIHYAIKYDAQFNYQTATSENLEKLLKEINEMTKQAKTPK